VPEVRLDPSRGSDAATAAKHWCDSDRCSRPFF
jgi:hypothetical protein